jgi:hypothetical protein
MSVMKRLFVSLAITVLATLLLGLIYPAIRGEAARSPDDKLGEMLGTFGIPVVFVLSFYGSLYLEKKRKERSTEERKSA